MYRWKDRFFVKATAFLFVVICAVAVVLSALTVMMNVKFQWYSMERKAVEESILSETAGYAQDRIISRIYDESAYYGEEAEVVVIPYDEEFLYEEDAADFGYVIRSQKQSVVRFENARGKLLTTRKVNESLAEKEGVYREVFDHGDMEIEIYIGEISGYMPDEILRVHYLLTQLYQYGKYAMAVGIVGLLMGLCLTVFLLVTTGKKEKASVLDKLPVEMAVIAVLLPVTAMVAVSGEFVNRGIGALTETAVTVLLLVIAFDTIIIVSTVLGVLLIVAIKVRRGNLWSSSLVYRGYRLIIQIVKSLWGALRNAFRKAAELAGYIPLVWKSALILAAGVVVNLFLTVGIGHTYFHGGMWIYHVGFWILWFAGAVLTFAAGIYIAVSFKRLSDAAKHLAEGDLEYQVDRKGMLFDMASCADDLNSIGEGMKKAVHEKMKSERLKTELITNVSHDIKTPLTSIINYTDLLKKEGTASEHADEYIEVIDRQSQRLKKLTEDLIEASKVTAGAVKLQMDRLRLGILMMQVAGEYQSRMEEKNLKLVSDIPEDDIAVMADGRHMQRVLDNLMNNICKYAQPDTRVYQTLFIEQGRVVITYKNISKEELNITETELMERFVRGDRSRNTEGSGLGLSIAKNLVELQGGELHVEIDGDLFKAIVSFPL